MRFATQLERIGSSMRVALISLSAAAMVASQPPCTMWLLAGVGLVPWLIAVRSARRIEAMLLGALFGTLYGCGVSLWIPEALRSLNSSPAASFSGLLLIGTWAKAPLFAIVASGVHRSRNLPAVAQVAMGAGLLALGEAIISNSSWGVPAALLGHSQAPSAGLAQLSVIEGVPLLSALLFALNHAIALALLRVPNGARLATAITVSWLASSLLGLPLARALRPASAEIAPVSALVIQPDIPRHQRWDHAAQRLILDEMSTRTVAALAESPRPPDLILWPENLVTSAMDREAPLRLRLQGQVDLWGVPLVTGLVRSASGEDLTLYRSSALWLEPGAGELAAIDKVRAIPILESNVEAPGGTWLRTLFGGAGEWPRVVEAASAPALVGRMPVTATLCYEVLFPDLVRTRRPADSRFILNLADDSWVSVPAASEQLLAWASFRAIEQRLPLVRVAHGGLSAIVDEFGQVELRLPRDSWQHALVTIRPSPPPTPLERVGLFMLPTTIGAVVSWADGRRRRSHTMQ